MNIEIDVLTLKQRLDLGERIVLLDCREPFERELARIENVGESASLFVPMNDTPTKLPELVPLRHENLVIYCHGGFRSYHVAQWLSTQGFLRAQSLAGGIDDWSCQIDSTVPRY